MAKDITPLRVEWIPELADFLRTEFQVEENSSFATTESLHWKYFDPDGSGLTGRSLVAREHGRIIGHIGYAPTTFVHGSSNYQSCLHMMDWIAPARHAPVGAMLMLQAFRQAESQFAIGGNDQGRQVSARAGYKNLEPVITFQKVLNPKVALRSSTGHAWKKPLRLAKNYARMLTNRGELPKVSLRLSRVEQFGDEIDQIVATSRMTEVHTLRTASRLNHHLRHPQQQVSGWLLSDSEKVCGYAVLNLVNRGSALFGKIVDLLLDSREDLCHSALYRLTEELRNQEADIVECYATTPWMVQALDDNGFSRSKSQDFALRDPLRTISSCPAFYLTQLEADHGYL